MADFSSMSKEELELLLLSMKKELDDTRSELSCTVSKLDDTRNELNEAENRLSTTQSKLEKAKSQLSIT